MIGLEGKTLRSERLWYRLLEDGDKGALWALLSDPAVAEPAGFEPAKTQAEFDAFFTELTQYHTAIGVFLEQTLIGYIHVGRYRPGGKYADKSCVSTGFAIGSAYQGHGYGTEMLRTVTAYLKSKFDFCFADHFLDNEASHRVIAKCGYVYCDEYSMYFEKLGKTLTCKSYVF